MRLKLLPVVLLVAVLSGCGGQASSGPSANAGPPATGTGTLVLIRGDNLWSVRTDGSNGKQLTHESGGNFANNPIFSPDGSLIAYARHIAPSGSNWGGAELRVVRADGSEDRVLVESKAKGERAEDPAWAPDGKSVYFAHDVPIIEQNNTYTGDKLSIDRVPVAGGTPEPVVKNGIFPTTSPAGGLSWVLYNAPDATFQLQVGGLDGSSAHTLITEKDFQALASPRFSPDGKSIVFSGSGRTDSKVAFGALLAEALNPLLPGRAQAHGLPWDPWVIGADGKGLRKLVSIGSDEQALAWSPDGRLIAMSNLSATFLMRADGSGLNRILTQGDAGGIDWKP